MDSVIPEPGISLDPRFLGQDIVVLSLKIGRDLLEAGRQSQLYWRLGQIPPVFVVNALSESRRIDNRQSDPSSIFFQLDVVLLDTYRVFLVSPGGGVGDSSGVKRGVQILGILMERCRAMSEKGLIDKGVDKGCSATTRGACILVFIRLEW
jgi:hypothetical protein